MPDASRKERKAEKHAVGLGAGRAGSWVVKRSRDVWGGSVVAHVVSRAYVIVCVLLNGSARFRSWMVPRVL